MIDYHLKDKVVLITGANHGIGAATAKAFACQNAKVFITYYRPESRYSPEQLNKARQKGIGSNVFYSAMQQQTPKAMLDEIKKTGGIARAHEFDLGLVENIKILFDMAEKELGPVDILVNNHTHCTYDTFDPALTSEDGREISVAAPDTIDKHFAINTRAYVLMMTEYTQRFINRKADWGRIINISTDAAHGHEAAVSYAASKHAIESYSRSAAAEIGKYGVTVNIVAPGPIQTGYLTPEQEADITAKAPLRRVGKPEDVADVIIFLASEQARWLTGQLIYVGGGWRMHQ
jgi:3-oxoacyl-[acyl-carrier protein] reductase